MDRGFGYAAEGRAFGRGQFLWNAVHQHGRQPAVRRGTGQHHRAHCEKLYSQADITVAGFETTDRRDFYDLAVGNVPFSQYKVNDKAYNKLGFSIHNYFFAKAIDENIACWVTFRPGRCRCRSSGSPRTAAAA